MNNKSIPKGWIYCPKNAKKLMVSKFMPIKTPLSSKYNKKLQPADLFPPGEIFSKAKRNQVRIGLWINLCNTERYYSKEDIEKQSCQYIQLKCLGHGTFPSKREIKMFISIVDDFIINAPHDCIVVHCTHGFNRTGFMIVIFLVEKLRYPVEKAVELFTEARPPGIYRRNYLVELFRRYSRGYSLLPFPVIPSWCQEKDININKKKNSRF